MRKIIAITTCHMPAEILAFSVMKGIMTGMLDVIDQWVFLDHLWPIDSEQTSRAIESIARQPLLIPYRTILDADKNRGSVGGWNWALNQLGGADPHNLYLYYDADSNPVTPGWLAAMVEALEKSPLDFVSLQNWDHNNGFGQPIHEYGGHKVMCPKGTRMWNVTLFKGTTLKNGLLSPHPYYAYNEKGMWDAGYRGGYMVDFKEEICPIPNNPLYTKWKVESACGQYKENFDQFVRERQPTQPISTV